MDIFYVYQHAFADTVQYRCHWEHIAICCFWRFLFSFSSAFTHCALSSTEVNSRIFCCQTPDLQVLSAAGHIFSHVETALKRTGIASRIWTCAHPPDPFQSSPWSLLYPADIVVCHVKPRYDTWHLHCVSRSLHLRWRLVQFDLTPDSCKKTKPDYHSLKITWRAFQKELKSDRFSHHV